MILFLSLIAFVLAGDPADSWLTYAIATQKSRILYFYAEAVVPSAPSLSFGEPAFWIGIEPQPALNLIQPIMPKYLATDYYIFVEQFDWKTGNDYQSNAIYVTPGQRVFGSITYDSTNDTYLMETGIVGMANNSIASYAPYYHKGQVFTDAYIVLEHQPTLCAQFPSSNQITFDNIKVVWENGVKTPSWKSFQYKPACNSTTTVVNSTKVKINWQS